MHPVSRTAQLSAFGPSMRGIVRASALLLPLLFGIGMGSLAPKPIAAGAKRLILVRHGAVSRSHRPGWPNIPPVRDGAFYGGNIDVPLSVRGEHEARAAAEFISTTHVSEIDAVWSSTMSRALFGARAIADSIAYPIANVQAFDEFKEFDRGLWTNMTMEEVESDTRWGAGAFARCSREDMYGREMCKGEGMGELRARVLSQRDRLFSSLPAGRAAVLVSHLWVTRALLGEALGEKDPLAVDVPTASVSVVDYPAEFVAEGIAAAMPVVQYQAYKPDLDAALDASLAKGQAES